MSQRSVPSGAKNFTSSMQALEIEILFLRQERKTKTSIASKIVVEKTVKLNQ